MQFKVPEIAGWRTKMFKTQEAKDSFEDKNKRKYQMVEVFVNNAYAMDIRPLRKM